LPALSVKTSHAINALLRGPDDKSICWTMPSIYIINPLSTASYHSAEAFDVGGRRFTQVADLAIATVAAFVPSHWRVALVDEAIAPVDLDHDADFIAITGKVSQRSRMLELADHFRALGKTVIIGGSFASLTPDDVGPHADILFTGEMEDIADTFFADLEAGAWRSHYEGGQADLTRSPRPRWDLYPLDRAFSAGLQTSRGCPFNCEFCDVIQYQGRKQRHKTVAQVIDELDCLYALGCRSVFLVDDNFTVHRRHANAILDALIDWNGARGADRVNFLTQASLDVAREPDLLEKCHRAGLRTFFMGVETDNEASLIETGKKQNLLTPPQQAFEIILSHGIAIQAGVIVGFDHDDATAFDRLFAFLQASPIPDVGLGVLTAPRATHLFRRLQREGRLRGEVWEAAAGTVFSTNIAPARMSREELIDGARDLAARLFEPTAFQARMQRFIDLYGDDALAADGARGGRQGFSQVFFAALKKISDRGPAETEMVAKVLRMARRKPATLPSVMHFLARYEQTRYVLDAAEVHVASPRDVGRNRIDAVA
jgi:hypothetical protein